MSGGFGNKGPQGGGGLTASEILFVQTADDGVILIKEGTAPSATSGYGKIYVKSSDSLLYFKDDAGNEYPLTVGGSGLTKELPVGTVDDLNTSFTVSNEPFFINVNGLIYEEGDGVYQSYSGGTITLSTPVGTGGFIKSYY